MKQHDSHLNDAERRAGTTEGRTLDNHLASLLGYLDIDITGGTGLYNGFYNPLPRWTEDDSSAFGLIVAHKIDILFSDGDKSFKESVEAVYETGVEYGEVHSKFVREDVEEHESKAAATRKAVVRAVIAKLEAEQEKK